MCGIFETSIFSKTQILRKKVYDFGGDKNSQFQIEFFDKADTLNLNNKY